MEEVTSPEEQPTIFQHALKWGLIMSGISIFITILLYVIDYTIMIQLKFGLLSMLLYLGITIFAGINYRNSVGGFLPYGKAFQHGFMMLAISGLVGTIFGFILYNLIDPELPQKLVDASIENTRAMMENFGVSGDQVDEALEKAKTETASRFTLVGQLKSYLWILVFSAIISLITSIFVKKNQPVEQM